MASAIDEDMKEQDLTTDLLGEQAADGKSKKDSRAELRRAREEYDDDDDGAAAKKDMPFQLFDFRRGATQWPEGVELVLSEKVSRGGAACSGSVLLVKSIAGVSVVLHPTKHGGGGEHARF